MSWNTREIVLDCIRSIYDNTSQTEFEIILLDNASTDGTVDAVAEAFETVKLIASQDNLGFAGGNNRATELATYPNLLLLNPDTIVHPGSIDMLLQYFTANVGLGAVGPRTENPDGSLQVSAWPAPTLFREAWRMFHLDRVRPLAEYGTAFFAADKQPQTVDVLLGACILMKTELYWELGGFDEAYFIYSEEVDLCERIRATGRRLMYCPQAVITHLGGQSTGQVADEMFLELYRNKVKFFRKRRGKLNTALYKGVLWAASISRLLGSRLSALLKRSDSDHVTTKTRQYRKLLAGLGEM